MISVNLVTSEPFHKGGAKPRVVIEDRGNALIEGIDYTLKYKNNTPQTKKSDDDEEKIPTVSIIGKGNYTGIISKAFAITIRNIAEVDMTASDVNYQKKAGICRPSITLIDTTAKVGTTFLNKSDYDIVGFANNDKKGTATVTLKGAGFLWSISAS